MVSREAAPGARQGSWWEEGNHSQEIWSQHVPRLSLSLLGLDQGGDTCVHEIPFHFDLMGLLPQCQQLQMFFLLLSRGG